MGRLVFLKILGGIALLMMLSLGAAVLWIQNVPSTDDREPASVASRAVFVDQGMVDANQVLQATAISNPIRARKVIFDSMALHEALQNPGGTIDLAMFADKKVRIRLQNASEYGVNQHLVVGQIDGDRMSSVRMQVFEDSMDARIQSSSEEFRVVPLGQGVHMIVETRTKNSN
ncbi:MAG: hypothetical protein AAB250_12410 [Bdellovibrionota bacterium]